MISIRAALLSTLLLFSSFAFAIPAVSPASSPHSAIDEFLDPSIRIKSDITRYLDTVDEGAFRIHEAPAAIQEAAEKIYYLMIFAFQQNAFHLPEVEFNERFQPVPTDELAAPWRDEDGFVSPLYFGGSFVYQDLIQSSARTYKGRTLYPYVGRSISCTAFATHEGRSLWTARHCIQDLPAEMRDSGSMEFVAYIFDNRGHVVAGPISYADLGQQITKPIDDFDWSWRIDKIPEDFVEFRPRNLVLPRFFEIATPTIAQKLFTLGNPSTTNASMFAQHGIPLHPRKNGHNGADAIIRYSAGVRFDTLSMMTLKSFSGRSWNPTSAFNARNLVFSSADGFSGYSGGPIVDSKGRVIAIYSSCETSVDAKEQIIHNLTIGVRPPSWSN